MAKTKHKCAKSDIMWRKTPDLDSSYDTSLLWRGRCATCKRNVYEVYEQQAELYDAGTDKEV